MQLFETVNQKGGDAITSEEWMQNGNYKGLVYNDFADPLEKLSEYDSHFMRQYLYIGSTQNETFSVSMSYQDFSGADTTQTIGTDIDDLFEFSMTIPIYSA